MKSKLELALKELCAKFSETFEPTEEQVYLIHAILHDPKVPKYLRESGECLIVPVLIDQLDDMEDSAEDVIPFDEAVTKEKTSQEAGEQTGEEVKKHTEDDAKEHKDGAKQLTKDDGAKEQVDKPEEPCDNQEGKEEHKSDDESFSTLETAPSTHKFYNEKHQPRDPKQFLKNVRREIQLLRTNLPPGIVVKTFEDRLDLFSVMIKGPERTPYEDGLFFFDLQLSADYPLVRS